MVDESIGLEDHLIPLLNVHHLSAWENEITEWINKRYNYSLILWKEINLNEHTYGDSARSRRDKEINESIKMILVKSCRNNELILHTLRALKHKSAGEVLRTIIKCAENERENNIIIKFHELLMEKTFLQDKFYLAGMNLIIKIQNILRIILDICPDRLPTKSQIIGKLYNSLLTHWKDESEKLNLWDENQNILNLYTKIGGTHVIDR